MNYRYKGFTLLEIMIVVAIIGLLTAIATPGIIQARSRAREGQCHNNMRIIAQAIEQYTIEFNIGRDRDIQPYNNIIMPVADHQVPELFIPKYLKCPENNMTYGFSEINNYSLNVTCPVTTADKSHGTYGDII